MSIRTWPQFSARRLMSRRRRGVIWSAAHTCPSPASVTCALLERAMSGCRSTTYRESTQPFSSELDLDAGAAQGARLNVIHFFMLPGAVLIKSGDEVIGSIGVGGAPSGLVDEGCAKAGLEKIASSLK